MSNLPPLPPPSEPTPPPPDEPEPIVRFPVIERGVEDLIARRAVTRPQFERLAEDARFAAFTVARTASVDTVAKVQNTLAQLIAEGPTLKEFRRRIDKVIREETALSPAHVETVYRTNVAAAYSRGLADVLSDPLAQDEFPYLEYTAVHDSRTRAEHLEMERLGLNGTAVYRRDDPIWNRFLPPWSWNCRCGVIPLSIADAARKGVREAIDWQATGLPPAKPAWVPAPPFEPPPGFEVVGRMPAFT